MRRETKPGTRPSGVPNGEPDPGQGASRDSDRGSSAESWLFALAITAAFLLLGAAGVARHEMWRDELQAWLIGRDSTSLGDLFRNVRYEGHPPLWHLCLFLLARLHDAPGMMQGFHLLVAGTSVLLFSRFAPFPRLAKILFAFGYFPFYEYGIKSRGYALGVLFLILFCALFRWRHRRLVRLAALLFLLSFTSLPGTILAIALGLALVADFLFDRDAWRAGGRGSGSLTIAAGIVALGVFGSVLSILPPADSGYTNPTFLAFDAGRLHTLVSSIGQSYVPRLELTYAPAGNTLSFWAACIVFLGTALLLYRRPAALVFYLAGTLGLAAFLYTKYLGQIWHHGHFFLIWIAGLWIARSVRETRARPGFVAPVVRQAVRGRDVAITLVLLAQCVTGIRAYVRDWREPYSEAKAAARFIETRSTGETLLAGDLDYIVVGVAGYLPKGTEIFYIAGHRFGTFIRWDEARRRRLPPGIEALQLAYGLGVARSKDILFISSYEVSGDLPSFVQEIARFDRSIWPDERFYIYRLQTPR